MKFTEKLQTSYIESLIEFRPTGITKKNWETKVNEYIGFTTVAFPPIVQLIEEHLETKTLTGTSLGYLKNNINDFYIFIQSECNSLLFHLQELYNQNSVTQEINKQDLFTIFRNKIMNEVIEIEELIRS